MPRQVTRGLDGHSAGAEATTRTLDKGLRVLEVVGTAGRAGCTIGDLEAQLAMNRATAARFIQTLVRRGYIEPISPTDRYRLGLQALSLSAASLAGLTLRDASAPLLEELSRVTGETVHLVMLDGGEVVTIDRIEGVQQLALRTHIGARRGVHCTASGKAILAHLDENVVDALLARGMPALTACTITDPRVLKAQLQSVRLLGYALDEQELADGVRCAAAPVFDFTGRIVGAVSLSVPCLRVSSDRLVELAEHGAATARRLSRQLGYRPSPPGMDRPPHLTRSGVSPPMATQDDTTRSDPGDSHVGHNGDRRLRVSPSRSQ